MNDLTDEQRARALDLTDEQRARALDADPKPDPRVGLLDGVCLREGVVLTRSDAALLLSIADAAERPEAGA